MSASEHPALPEGVFQQFLKVNADERGSLTEIYRESWELCGRMVQWNVIDSGPNVLRGVRVHFKRADYISVLRGTASVGVRDLRGGSPTEGLSAVIRLDGGSPSILTVPSGVAHGLYSHGPVLYLVGVSSPNDGDDEQVCRWDEPGLEIAWPFDAPRISARDETGSTVEELARAVPPWRPR